MPGTGTEPAPDPDKMLNKLRNQEQVQEQFRFQHQDLPTLNEQIRSSMLTAKKNWIFANAPEAPPEFRLRLVPISAALTQ